jgi:hypothetical protein
MLRGGGNMINTENKKTNDNGGQRQQPEIDCGSWCVKKIMRQLYC